MAYSDEQLEEVELRPAFAWTCPSCGSDNFRADVIVEDPALNAELKHALLEHGVREDLVENGEFYYDTPEIVRCKHCRGKYRSNFPYMADDEIEFDGPSDEGSDAT